MILDEAIAVNVLDPCAHCGGQATITNKGRHTTGHGESSQEYSLGCHTKPCLVQIQFGGREDIEILEALADAIEAWNTRLV